MVQQRVILLITQGRNVIIQAESNIGRTATFSISILQSIDVAVRETQALVLLPTRELAACRRSIITALGVAMNVQWHMRTGGVEDTRKLKCRQHIVLGTPGRIFDAIQKRGLVRGTSEYSCSTKRASRTRSIESTNQYLPPTTQITFASSTLPHDVSELATKFMADLIHISVEREGSALEGISNSSW